jgi:DNA polymerase-1
MKDLSLQVWVGICATKAAKESETPDLKEVKREFLLNPPLPETLDYLRDRVAKADLVSVDIETGRGQINTIGFAVSPYEAIAINVLPSRLAAGPFQQLWSAVEEICSSSRPKIFQNFIYEHQYLSRYGVRLRGVTHDTMICQKFLWPEFEMGLDAIGRMYTDLPYWKEDGKSWNDIRDWERHYEYNCKDTTGTFAGYLGQRADLKARSLTDLHDKYIVRLYQAVAEMCARGLPVSPDHLARLQKEVATELGVTSLALASEAPGLNPKSPAQVKKFLSGKGYSIPKKYDAKTKTYKESTDEKSLKKLRLKYPTDGSLSLLLRTAKLNKASSSYLNFDFDRDDRMRYSLTAAATETLRMAGYCDPWGNGVNPQTIPGGNKGINIKSAFQTKPGTVLLAVDLRQAESRFVAYDSADLNLIQTLEDPLRDIHSEVACQILQTLGKPLSLMTDPKTKKFWRQLGKKSGHGANYSMKEATFMDSCIQEMDVVLTKQEATGILEAYHQLFPGIRLWHKRLRTELAQQRKLTTPFGWERYFYGRLDDDMFRQAYAFRPQSTIPFITNRLMLHLLDLRDRGETTFGLLLQCHDSLLLECPPEEVVTLAEAASKTEDWHPLIELSGGILVIPTETEVGPNYGEMTKWTPKQ